MVSSRGKPLTPEIKKLTVSAKQYFDRKKLTPAEPSVKRTADALGIGIATVKRIMADYNRDPKLLDKPAKLRGRPIYSVSASYQESTRSYIRAANKKGEYITLAVIKNFLEEQYPDESFNKATLARTLNRWGFEFGQGVRSQHLKEKDHVIAARQRYLREMRSNRVSVKGIDTIRPEVYLDESLSLIHISESMKQLKPCVKVAAEQFPKIYAGQYGAEISALLSESPDVVHTSFWGGDMEAFTLQGSVRGVFKKSEVVLTCGETAMHRLGTQLPEGTVIGGRGPFGNFAPDSELNSWFRKQYFDRYNTWPTYPAYKAAQALLGMKTAYEKAAKGGNLPTTDEVVAALENLVYEGPAGTVKMALANGHQAILDTAYGRYKYDKSTGQATITDVKRYKAECVNPPEGVKSLDWIQSGFKGAQCD